MVYGLPRPVGCGIILALSLTCAHAPLRAETLATAPAAQEGTRIAAPGNLQGNHQRTRFLIGLSKEAKFEVFSLNGRVVIEVEETKLRLPAQPTAAPVGLIRSFRAGESGVGKTRAPFWKKETDASGNTVWVEAREADERAVRRWS